MNTYYKSSGLTAGVYYQFKVVASNWIGLSPYSAAITIIAASVADPPINVRRVDSTKTSFTLTWDPAVFTGGTPVRDYQLYWDAGNGAMLVADFTELINTSYLTRVHQQPGLILGTHYRVFVRTRNDAGLSNPSAVLRLLAGVVPSSPLNLITAYQDEHTITLSWIAPSENVGDLASKYKIEQFNPVTSLWVVLDERNDLSITISSGLVTGQAYSFRVSA